MNSLDKISGEKSAVMCGVMGHTTTQDLANNIRVVGGMNTTCRKAVLSPCLWENQTQGKFSFWMEETILPNAKKQYLRATDSTHLNLDLPGSLQKGNCTKAAYPSLTFQ